VICSAVPSAAKPIAIIVLRHPGDEAEWANLNPP